MKNYNVRNQNDERRYFTMMLNMAEDDLDPYEYRLLAHFVRWAGQGGSETKSLRQMAEKTRMSVTKVRAALNALERAGYIIVKTPTEAERRARQATTIIVVDRWSENIARYSKTQGGEPECVLNMAQSQSPTVLDIAQSTPLSVPNIAQSTPISVLNLAQLEERISEEPILEEHNPPAPEPPPGNQWAATRTLVPNLAQAYRGIDTALPLCYYWGIEKVRKEGKGQCTTCGLTTSKRPAMRCARLKKTTFVSPRRTQQSLSPALWVNRGGGLSAKLRQGASRLSSGTVKVGAQKFGTSRR